MVAYVAVAALPEHAPEVPAFVAYPAEPAAVAYPAFVAYPAEPAAVAYPTVTAIDTLPEPSNDVDPVALPVSVIVRALVSFAALVAVAAFLPVSSDGIVPSGRVPVNAPALCKSADDSPPNVSASFACKASGAIKSTNAAFN